MLLWLTLALPVACAKGPPPEPAAQTWSEADRDDVRLDLVALMVEGGAYDSALRAIAELRKEGVEGVRLEVLAAQALMGSGRPEEALAALASQRGSRDPAYYQTLGLVYLDLRRLEEAVEANRKGLRYTSRDGQLALRADLYNNLGFALVSLGQLGEGIAAYQQALLLDPELQRCRNNLGFALAAQGEDADALAAFRLGQPPVTAPSAREANAWANLALAQHGRGDTAAACASLTQALAAQPDHPQAREALAALCPSTPEPEPPPEAP